MNHRAGFFDPGYHSLRGYAGAGRCAPPSAELRQGKDHMRPLATLAALVVPFTALLAPRARAQDATTPGTVTTPHPTVESLSVRWDIAGDDNQNGVVTLRFREEGESTWRTGLPLRRVPAASAEGFSWDNQHAGSMFNLQPGTTYEIELSLVDPDGGDSVQTVIASTRPIPVSTPAPPTA